MPRVIRPSVYWIILFVLLPLSVTAESIQGQAKPSQSAAFLDRYCAECHDSDTHKGGLNLEKLPFDLRGRTNQNAWENIFERVQNGSMPPSKADQPLAKERQLMLTALQPPLREASLERQKTEGRVILRRLSRSQYEDTLRDILTFQLST